MRRDEQFVVGERANLDVDVATGSLQVRVGATSLVKVTVDSGGADEMEISQIGDTVSVRENSRWLSRSRSARIVVEVPMRADVAIRGASLDITLSGTLGGVRCRTSSGDVQIEHVDRLELSSASGGVRVRTVNGDADINTASGDVYADVVDGRLTVQTASGDLAVAVAKAGLEIGTASGDVRVDRCDGSDINVKTVSGGIRLGLPAGIRVDPDISTMSGKVTLPVAASTLAGPPAERRSVRVRLRAVSGDIRIDRVG